MILLRDLTKLEREKLDGLKQEILGGFRKRVTPVFKRADGTVEAIKPRVKLHPWKWAISADPFGTKRQWSLSMPSYMEPMIRDGDAMAARVELLTRARGINWNSFINKMIQDMQAAMGIPMKPQPLGRGTVTVIPPEKPKPLWTETVKVGVKHPVQASQFLTLKDIAS